MGLRLSVKQFYFRMKNISVNNIKTNKKRAFTLIELLVVMAIISLLSAIALNSLASARMKANDAKISQDLRQFRIAAELYYNDNHEYPPTAMNSQDSKLAVAQESNSTWSKKLSFFSKTAEAASGHPLTPLCSNFDAVAGKLVTKKYLSTIPVHPYDNDANHVCYKAVNATTTFSAYASLTTQVSVGSGSSAGTINRRTGFILGDTSSVGISNLIALTPAGETTYPIASNGNTATDLSASIDVISGITGGSSNSLETSGVITNNSTTTATTTATSTTYTLVATVLNSPGGFINVNPNKSSYNSGDAVTITAYPNPGYLLSYWIGCTSTNSSTCYVTMDADKQIYASFNTVSPN